MRQLGANARLDIFGKRNVPAKNMQNRRLAPTKAVTKIQFERPVAQQLRPRFGLHGSTRFRLTMDMCGEAIGALPSRCAVNRYRPDDAITAPIERDEAGALDIAPDVAIGVDPKA